MDKIEQLIANAPIDNHLTLDDIPDIDLYMDQVIQLFEKKYEGQKRNADEKVLTKTMINNYAKGKLFFPVNNKKYSKEHLILISIIYQLKGALSINDIKLTLENLNKKVPEAEFNIEKLYNSYLHLAEANAVKFVDDVKENTNKVKEEIDKLDDKDSVYLKQLLLITSLINMSNLYRKAAEKIVDEIGKEQDA
ncbi:DUF1836 domain-containing protein [Virgibacillus oceani]|uniref:Cytoplasmic protein n=1 Tax=Virgibacillus oceani TaxID=1479511 RepID=A0A917LZX3_9BACI|nr:DUF1836 domain-containing protein [Virgibacillus oceani]GGG66831.1 hypothetical protein GCM10011398_08120 [Virgibacillus oceani]